MVGMGRLGAPRPAETGKIILRVNTILVGKCLYISLMNLGYGEFLMLIQIKAQMERGYWR